MSRSPFALSADEEALLDPQGSEPVDPSSSIMNPVPSPAPSAVVVPPVVGSPAARSVAMSAGLGLLLSVGGAGLGYWAGGWRGMLSGLFGVGALRNGASMISSIKQGNPSAASVQSTLTLIDAGIAGYFGHAAYQRRAGASHE